MLALSPHPVSQHSSVRSWTSGRQALLVILVGQVLPASWKLVEWYLDKHTRELQLQGRSLQLLTVGCEAGSFVLKTGLRIAQEFVAFVWVIYQVLVILVRWALSHCRAGWVRERLLLTSPTMIAGAAPVV